MSSPPFSRGRRWASGLSLLTQGHTNANPCSLVGHMPVISVLMRHGRKTSQPGPSRSTQRDPAQPNKWSSQALCSCPPACCTAGPLNSSAVLPVRRIKTQPSPCWAHHQWERPVNKFQNNARGALPVLWAEETNFVWGCWREDGTLLQLWRNGRELLEKAVERTAWGGH